MVLSDHDFAGFGKSAQAREGVNFDEEQGRDRVQTGFQIAGGRTDIYFDHILVVRCTSDEINECTPNVHVQGTPGGPTNFLEIHLALEIRIVVHTGRLPGKFDVQRLKIGRRRVENNRVQYLTVNGVIGEQLRWIVLVRGLNWHSHGIGCSINNHIRSECDNR